MRPTALTLHPLFWILPLALLLGLLACSGPVVSAADTTEATPESTGTTTPEATTPTSTTGSVLTTEVGETISETGAVASTGPPGETSGSTTGEASLCGNSVVDEGESCDFGEYNWDHGACTSQCQAATCGDGLIFEGVEACDNGELNGPGYDQCDACQFGPRCGDGVLTPEFEECDAGGGVNGDGDGGGEVEGADTPCKAGCTWDGRIIFISSVATDAEFGGITGAELRCQNLAKASHLDGHAGYSAWLSDADDSPFTRLEFGPERLVMLNGKQVAANLAALISDGPGDGITVTEQRTTLMKAWVWTNTAVNGEIFSESNTCLDWTTAVKQKFSYVGLNAVPKLPMDSWTKWSEEKQWTWFKDHFCFDMAHLYCVEGASP
jgi:hypothetical protein